VPEAVVTEIGPVVAPLGTVAVILLLLWTVKPAEIPLNFTEVTPVKFDPLIVTDVPATPLVGEKLVIAAPVKLKVPLLVAVPVGVVTEILPVVAPFGTVAVILLLFWTVKPAEIPLNFTEVAPLRFVPLIVTDVPT
jgi:hypothetical protein